MVVVEGIEEAIAHPSDPLPVEARAALAVGLLLFVGGLGFAMWRASCSVKWARVIVSLSDDPASAESK